MKQQEPSVGVDSYVTNQTLNDTTEWWLQTEMDAFTVDGIIF